MVENCESINAPKCLVLRWKYNKYEMLTKSMNRPTRHNLKVSIGNMKDYEKISRINQKSGSPKRIIFTVAFEEKSMMTLQDKKGTVQECLYLPSCLMMFDDNEGRREVTEFLILGMARTTATFRGPCDEGRR